MSAVDTKLAVGVEPRDRQRASGVLRIQKPTDTSLVPHEQHPGVAAEVGDLHQPPLALLARSPPAARSTRSP